MRGLSPFLYSAQEVSLGGIFPEILRAPPSLALMLPSGQRWAQATPLVVRVPPGCERTLAGLPRHRLRQVGRWLDLACTFGGLGLR